MGFSLADNLESIDCEKYLYAITGKKISQLTSDQVALLGMTTGAGVIVISAAAFAGGYPLATSGKIATVAKSLAVKGGEIVKTGEAKRHDSYSPLGLCPGISAAIRKYSPVRVFKRQQFRDFAKWELST